LPPPKVSIITATYNWSGVLRYAIQSVLWQTFQDFEYLVIGDACTDDSAEVVASFNDPRIKWYNLPENSGSQSAPNNAGLERAQGTYIAYLGHDDIWHPAHLESLVTLLDQTGADLAYALIESLGAPGTGIRVLAGIRPNKAIVRKLPPSGIMHRRDVVEHIGLWKDYRTIHAAPDLEFINRIWEYRERIACTDKLTVFKFTVSWRANSYREKRSDEQAEYVRRIQTEPDFLEREWFGIATAFINDKASVPKIPEPDGAAPGWLVTHYRKMKGLDAQELPASQKAPSGLDRLSDPFKRYIRRVLHKLLRMMGDT
jgi:glycosyltransferase involved in cell wall biosynthesis